MNNYWYVLYLQLFKNKNKMGGKKIDRKKQSLLSRSAKRKSTIKKLSRKPVIKKVDIEAIKESFKKNPKAEPKTIKSPEDNQTTSEHAEKDIAKTHRKPKKA
jgi:hypothetical protein